ncbi:MAG TPA: hypothetical protein VF530_01850 [Planctomycetota bacterium]
MRPREARRGSTLIELLVVLGLLGTVVGTLASMGSVNARLCATGVTHSSLEASARRALERLGRELVGARAGSLDTLAAVPLWQQELDFDRMASMRPGDGRITWSATRAEFRHEPGELDNGLDDDGDGLIDEGLVVLVLDAGGADEQELVLARGVRELAEGEQANGLDDNGNGLVDERGLALARDGRDLRLYLTLEGLARDGMRVTRAIETTVWARN